jgi:hypothetical protein
MHSKKDRTEIERIFKVLIKSMDSKPLNPWFLFSNKIGEETIVVIDWNRVVTDFED